VKRKVIDCRKNEKLFKRYSKKKYTDHGYTFESEIRKSLYLLIDYGYQFFYKKLVDTKIFDINLFCNHCHRKVQHNLILPKTIADYVIFCETGTHFIECKSSRKKEYYPFGNIKNHQIEYGIKIHKYPHSSYYFMICDRRVKGDYKVYLVDAHQMDDLMGENYPRRNATWEEIAKVGVLLKRLKYSQWDLIPYFEKIGVDINE
jgi:penicillin-binding protein-related factor A (putative recombinase)